MPTNEMQLAKAFRENAGLDQAKAEALATTIFDAIRDNVATKSDLDRLEHRLTLRGLGTLATGLTALFAALHYWPPHLTP
jgi:hypothetical protein